MKFFFPDSHDYVDPKFDFVRECSTPSRERHLTDAYAHEVLDAPPYDGLLISKSIVDGTGSTTGKYTMAQRHRLFREGAHRFFRVESLRASDGGPFPIMGDCGAFAYIKEDAPPISVDDAIDFYEECGLTHGQSVDHIIADYKPKWDEEGLFGNGPPDSVQARYDLTLRLAADFLQRHRERGCDFVPIAVAQGWSPASYAGAVVKLQKMGYGYIALGGLVPLRTHQIMEVLATVMPVVLPTTSIHLLGVLRWETVDQLLEYGIESIDTTSPLRQAFLDAKNNYYRAAPNYGAYPAVRVPQSDGNSRLKARVLAGEVDCDDVRELERRCLAGLRSWDDDADSVDFDELLGSLGRYAGFMSGRDAKVPDPQALLDRPWQSCPCRICQDVGIEVMLFRGANRNRRRGFHNLYVAHERLRAARARVESQPTVAERT